MNGQSVYAQCWHLIKLQKFSEATPLAIKLTEQSPNRSQPWYMLSVAARGIRNGDLALNAISKASELEPENLDFLALKSLCFLSAGRISEAISLAKSLQSKNDLNAYILNSLSIVFQATDCFEEQLQVTKQVVKLAPNNVVSLSNYAEVLRNAGLLDEAIEVYEKTISIDPTAYGAYWGRSQCYKASPEQNAVDSLQEALSNPKLTWRDKMQLSYALAKEFEDLGEHKQAFAALKVGADERRTHSNYNVQGDIETMEALRRYHGKISPSTPGNRSTAPIFVIGLPRSGTTLVERILGSHSCVTDAGELQDFPIEMVKQIRSNHPGEQLNKLSTVQASTSMNFQALGNSYIRGVTDRIPNTPNFVDKLPLNYLNVGLITRALPNAKIVLLQRNPMDSCYAMYKTLFAEAYPFSYCLSDLAKYYIEWSKLMDHWIKTHPNEILPIKYEGIVTDTKNSVSSLLKFCGLDWEDSCLEFHKRKDGVSTASAAQVRQPIYTSSLEKWRKYEQQLLPLKHQLETANLL